MDNDDDDGRSGFFKEDGVVGVDILIFLDDDDAVGCSNFPELVGVGISSLDAMMLLSSSSWRLLLRTYLTPVILMFLFFSSATRSFTFNES